MQSLDLDAYWLVPVEHYYFIIMVGVLRKKSPIL